VRKTAYYWYVIDNKIVAERYQAKWESLLQAFKKRKTAAAIVVVTSETALPSDEAVGNVLDYVEQVIPAVNAHLN
jgi:hypothetical protein